MLTWKDAVAIASAFQVASAAFYETYNGQQISPAKYEQYRLMNLVPYCAIEVKECDEKERRRLDCSCNNLHSPQRGTTLTPYRRLLPPVFGRNYEHRPSSSGAQLPNARSVRTSINSDGRVSSKQYTHLVTNGVVTITGDITSVHDTLNYVVVTTNCCLPGGDADPRCMPVRVPEDDVHLRRSSVRCLNLTRAITYQSLGCAPDTLPPERINTSPPMLELSIIYGNDEPSAMRFREMQGGRLKSDYINGKEWPPSGSVICIQNQLQRGETRCHNTPVPGTNILIGANIMGMWFYRNHNEVARKLEALNPCWDDDHLFYEAREITIAFMNQIWYYEMMTAILGYEFLLKNKVIFETRGHVNDYDPKLEPQVSIEYVVSSRWFHTMQDGRLKTYDKKGNMLDEFAAVEMTLRTGVLPNNRTIEGMTQGSFRQPSAAVDHMIDPDMGERVLGGLQFASDVMTSDLMKNRDAGLPPYVDYRKLCGLPIPKDFDDLEKWLPKELVESLRFKYETVEDVDLLAGILSEKPMPGVAIGPTMACIMVDQLRHWRRADRFWYENKQHPEAFTKEQLYEIRQMTMARLICDHGDDVDAVQPYAFLVPGKGDHVPYQLPIKRTLDRVPPERLPSRRPFWSDPVIKNPFDIESAWRAEWQSQECSAGSFVQDPTFWLPGFKGTRQHWTTLNRIRTGVGRCNYHLHKWGLKDSPACDCGAPEQMAYRVTMENPFRRFTGSLDELNELTPEAVARLDPEVGCEFIGCSSIADKRLNGFG